VKILVLSFYFRPDLSAGSFRTTALVDALRSVLSADSRIDVITTLPNRYHSFTADAPVTEHDANVSVTRIALPAHRNGLADQSRSFLAFSRAVREKTAGASYDVVFATSSRLMTAVLGAWIARQRHARLYLDIRDIFVDTIQEALPRRLSWFARPVFARLEKWAVRRASTVNLVSPGFSQYFIPRYPGQRFAYHTNGVDDEFISSPTPSDRADSDAGRPITVLYAGNVGEGQGLHAIIPQLASALADRVRFRVIGAGGRMSALRSAISASGVTNVELLDPLPRAELIAEYRSADVLFLHLNAYEAFKKVLPSKIFEYAATGKPVWAGVAGYAAEFITAEVCNSAVFPPCDVDAALRAFARLTIRDSPRTTFTEKYARSRISRAMAEDILAVAGGG
jgi:glycosyltransferase involved in cell wall biosynthesis